MNLVTVAVNTDVFVAINLLFGQRGKMELGTAKLLLLFGVVILWCAVELWRVRRKPRR